MVVSGEMAIGEELGALLGQAAAAKALGTAALRPVHAYLFVGPPGTGKLAAAEAFGAMLLCPNGGGDGCDSCRRAMARAHPDFVVMEREGAALSIDQAREVARIAVRSPVEGGRVVIVLPDLHLASDAVPALLKTIEEPPPPTVFVALAEFVPPELVTIASRCVRVDFRPLSVREVSDVLVAEGLGAERALLVAGMAGGRLDRARLLASDPEAEVRWRSWQDVPGRLDGSGATVAAVADELVELLRRSVEPLVVRQEAEVAALVERNARELQGAPGRTAQSAARAGVRELEERHRREQRRQRTDELRAGLAALAAAYRDRAVSGALDIERAAGAVGLIDGLAADLAFNPGEQLALQALLLRLYRTASR
jgi:DNA polymerase-3 subunit delta'